MQCQQVIEWLERHSPSASAMEGDNVGLLAGRRDKEVCMVMVALDATDSVIEEAVDAGADMLITHHPLIFVARKSVTMDDRIGRRLIRLIQNDISYYAMHTNFDVWGMADLSAQKLGLEQAEVLEVTSVLEDGTKMGIGKVGQLPKELSLIELAELVKERFQLDSVRISGEGTAILKRAAISGGSGKSMVCPALEAGADVLISGDLDHHTVMDAVADGLSIIDAGHYGTEKMFVPYLKQYLEKNCAGLKVRMAKEQSPFFII